MRTDEYRKYDAVGLGELIAQGAVSAAEVLDTAVASLEERNPGVNAVVTRCDEVARGDVDALMPGPLSGVPYLVKDLFCDVAGVRTTNGSRLYADYVPTVESTLVTRLRAAGLLIVGKTNTPEFGQSVTTEPGLHGPARNPWNPERSTGGSSGGAAAAVAAGIVPAAHATDGGGSIRIPAACCGLFGLKPTRGRITPGPWAGEGWAGLGGAHAVTRTVRDSAALLDATCAPEPGDPYHAPAAPRPYSNEVGADPGRLRIGLILNPVDPRTEVDPECRLVTEAAAHLCTDLGHDVEPVTWPDALTRPGEILGPISSTHMVRDVDRRLAQLGRPLRDGDLDATTRLIYENGKGSSADRYLDAVDAMHTSGRLLARLMGRYDVLLTPTVAVPTPRIGEMDPNGDPRETLKRVARMAAFTSLFNITGQPAMSVPLGAAADGMPLGVQFVGRYGDETTLFRLAGQLEQAAPWAGVVV